MLWWLSARSLPLSEKIKRLPIGLTLAIFGIAIIGYFALYSAGGGSDLYAGSHALRLGVGLAMMFCVALIDIRLWRQMAWPIYILCLLLLIFVEVKGQIGMGAQRWLNLGFMRLQPSEVMKVSLVMVLCDYYARIGAEDVKKITSLFLPLCLIGLPAGLVMMLPDLGTALKLIMIGVVITFLAGTKWWVYIVGASTTLAAIPMAWLYILKPYQKRRVLTFLDPSSDPLGAGYHVTQSKIALGSGGIGGRGYLEGTQGQLNFLPEKQTDFIFTLWAEECGFFGAAFLLALFATVFFYALMIGLRARHTFLRLLALGVGMNIMLYVFINVGMVMGVLPVVGVPLPMVSYGGTVILTTCFALGILMSVAVHRDMKITRFN